MKKFEIEMLPPILEDSPINYNTLANSATIRLCIDVDHAVADKVRDHAYQFRLTQKEMLVKIVEEYITNNVVDARPQTLKAKGKPGPRRKIKI